jgi:hypothetical protein
MTYKLSLWAGLGACIIGVVWLQIRPCERDTETAAATMCKQNVDYKLLAKFLPPGTLN